MRWQKVSLPEVNTSHFLTDFEEILDFTAENWNKNSSCVRFSNRTLYVFLENREDFIETY